MTIKKPDVWSIGTAMLMVVLAGLILLTATDYGDSWDEKIRVDSGEKKLQYYHHLVTGQFSGAKEIAAKADNYPGFHDLNLALLRRVSPLSDFTTGNYFSALLGFIGVLGAIYLARLAGGPAAGFWAGLLLCSLPAWYGHMFINPKDIPFAAGYVWALAASYRWLQASSPKGGTIALAGLGIGITMASRIGGLVLVCYLGLFLGLRLIETLLKQRTERGKALKAWLRSQVPAVIVVTLVAFAILLLYWPTGQANPFGRTSSTLENVTRYDWPMPVFFEGAFLNADDLPWYYILKMILLKVPVVTLLLVFSGLAIVLVDLIRSGTRDSLHTKWPLENALIAFAVLFPVSYVIARDSILYNGLRHLLFVLPPMAALAGWAAVRLYLHFRATHQRLTPVLSVAMALGILLPVIQLIRLHPYQYIYYNELAGGTKQAGESYELDYWGTVYKELAEQFYAHLVETKPTFSKPEVVVNMEHVTWLFTPFLPEETSLPIRVVRSRPDFDDYYAASTTWAANQFYAGEAVVEVSRAGVRLGVVKDRRGLSTEERGMGYGSD